MRAPTLVAAAVLLAGVACRRGSLQADDGGGGMVSFDAAGGAIAGDGGPGGAIGRDSGPGGATDAALPTADANCGQTSIAGGYVVPEILVVLDRSISVDPTQWSNFLSAIVTTIGANAVRDDWGLYAFPKDGPACGAGTVSTTIDVPIVQGNATHVIAHIGAAGTGASAAPTAAAIETATAYMLSLVDQSPKFLMLVTDGAPTCAGAIDALSADPTGALSDAVSAIDSAAAAGVHTLVVAPSTTTAPNDVAALNALALAGRHPRPPPGPEFETELTIGEQLTPLDTGVACVVNFATSAPVPDVVTVTLNGATIPRDQLHMMGWDYVAPGAATIELWGSWCAQLKTSRSWTLTATFGCP